MVNAGQMKRLVNESQNLTLMIIKQRKVLHNPFQTNVDICNDLFQFESRLSLKEDDKQLQQSTLVLNGTENKVSEQEVEKVQERAKKLDKEGTRFRNDQCWCQKYMVQW